MKTPFLTAIAIVGVLLFSHSAQAVVVYNYENAQSVTNIFESSQMLVDVSNGFEQASSIAGGSITVEHVNDLNVNGSGDIAGMTQLLTFAAPARLVGLVVSGLFGSGQGLVSQISSTGQLFGQLIAYDADGNVVLDAVIKSSQNGMAFIDFGGLVDDISLLTLSTGGGLEGLSGPATVAGLIMQMPEPSALLLIGLGLIMAVGVRSRSKRT